MDAAVQNSFPKDLRPLLSLTDAAPTLFTMQRDGICFDKALDINDVAGNGARQHLTAE